MECGVIYIKVLVPKDHRSEWLKYCYLFSVLPSSIQQNIKHIADDINKKYIDDIVIQMDLNLHPGCATKPESVETIATDMYNQFLELCDRQGLPECVRCVYSTGDLAETDHDSLHHVAHRQGGYDDVMVKLGRYLDGSDELGLFRI